MSYTADQIFALLAQRRFSRPEYVMLGQVANRTGGGVSRYMDGVALSLWPSRGVRLHAIEIKVERHDWLREAKDPKKADDVARFAHHMWLAVDGTRTRPVIDDIGEVPAAWGLLEIRETKGGPIVKTIRQAALLEPEPPTWLFVAAVLRRAGDAVEAEVETRMARELTVTRKQQADAVEAGIRKRGGDADELRRHVREFESATGFRVAWDDLPRVAEAIKALTGVGRDVTVSALEQAVNAARGRLERLEEAQAQVAGLEDIINRRESGNGE